MLQRVKEVQESDLRMDGALARNIQRVIAVTQADIDAAAAQGKAWVVKPVVKVSDPLDNLRGGTQLVIKQNSILPGQNVMRVMYIGGQAVVVGPGTSPLSLPDATDNDILSLIAFGGTEQRNLPDGYIERQFIYMMDGSYLLTDIVPTSDCKIEFDFQTLTIVSGARTYLGCRDSSGSNDGLRVAHISNGLFRIYGFGTYADSATAVQANTRYKFVWNNKQATITTGGTTVFDNTFAAEGTNQTAVAINGWNTAGTVDANSEGMYLYSFKVWDNQGNLIADYVPAVQRGTVPVVGFYDTVSETFKTATAGTFAAGGEAVPTPDAPMDIVSNNGVLKVRNQSGLPWGYTLLDYIESSGSQYIDTGIKGNMGVKADLDSSVSSATGVNYFLAARKVAGQPTRFYACTVSGVFDLALSEDSLGSEAVIQNRRYNFVMDTTVSPATLVIDGGTTITNGRSYNTGLNMYLFAANIAGVASFGGATPMRIYYAKIWEGNTLVRNFVPCKNSSNVVGMYDLVSEQFFTNQGTGDFTAGNAVSDPVEIYTDGTVETINVHSKNLFSGIVEQGGLSDGTGGETTSSVRIRTTAVPVKPNTTYNLSWTTNSGTAVVIRNAHFYNASNTWLGRLNASTFTTPPDTAFVRFVWQRSDSTSDVTPSDISNVQLELGSTATAYVPYYNGGTATAEMLLKAGDYEDVQSIIDGVVTRKVGVKVLDGTENWFVVTGYSNLYGLAVADGVFESNKLPMSTHYQGTTANNASMSNNTVKATTATVLAPNKVSIYVKDGANSTLENFKQWLADQYAAGTPVIVIYPLAESTTESVTGQPMATTEGNNIAEITQASLNNLELQVEYIGE